MAWSRILILLLVFPLASLHLEAFAQDEDALPVFVDTLGSAAKNLGLTRERIVREVQAGLPELEVRALAERGAERDYLYVLVQVTGGVFVLNLELINAQSAVSEWSRSTLGVHSGAPDPVLAALADLVAAFPRKRPAE